MSPEPPPRERRRSERVILRIPITVFGMTKDNRQISEEAETADISRTGALVLARTAFRPGGIIEITSKFSRQCEKFRVVWVNDEQKKGCFETGIEMLAPRDDFWGITFPSRPSPPKP
jgi:hypothetical protein